MFIKKCKRVKSDSGEITRSTLEAKIIAQLEKAKADYTYEKVKLKYNKPAASHTYTPDFVVTTRSGKVIYIESKGEFTVADRNKHLLIKAQYPDLDLRFVFQNSSNRLYKGSKTTYGKWCEKNGFIYCDKLIDINWLKE